MQSANQIWEMKESDVLDQAKRILAQQSGAAKSWNQPEHISLIANIAVEHGLPDTMKKKFISSLKIHGVGGNASQFRQWLDGRGVAMSKKSRLEKAVESLDY